MTYSLPNNLSNQELSSRQSLLDKKKEQYKFDVAVANTLGIRGIAENHERTNNTWRNRFQFASFISSLNRIANHRGLISRHAAKIRFDTVDDLENLEKKLLDDPTQENSHDFFGQLEYQNGENTTEKDQRQVKEYLDALLRWPKVDNIKGRGAELFDDTLFNRIPVAGPAPISIRQVSLKELKGFADRGFPVTDAIFLEGSPFYPEDTSLKRMAREGRLYLEDYSSLSELIGQEQNGESEARFCYSPLALYAQSRSDEQLYCIAIQCRENSRYRGDTLIDPNPKDDLDPWDPIFVPHIPGAATYESDLAGKPADYSWMAAKTIVNQAHNCFHEACVHLGRSHLLVEGIIITSNRQLHTDHPLYGLLQPHFEGTLNINEFGRTVLLNDGGIVDRYMSPKIGDFRYLAAKTVREYNITDELFPNSLAARNVANLSYYPYRDDALALWHAIREYTEDFLSLYYRSDEELQDDIELQKWWDELISPRSYGGSNGLYPLVAGKSYDYYHVERIDINGAADGYYTFHTVGPKANQVELRHNGTPVSTVDYNWMATIHSTNPSGYYTFDFPGYLSLTLSKAGNGTMNLRHLAETIFNGCLSVGVNVTFDLVGGLTPGEVFSNFSTRKQLYDLATWIIFTCSVQHAAFNYPQGDYFASVALMPGTVSKPTPVPGDTSKSYWMELLPPKEETVEQMNLMKLISYFRYTSLAGLDVNRFNDDRVAEAIATFKSRLKDIDSSIKDRNTKLPSSARYDYLLSSNIPLSTNI